jgi:hypothetical protein
LAVVVQNGEIPRRNTFLSNDLHGLQASLTTVFVDAGVTDTVIDGHKARGDDHTVGNEIDIEPSKHADSPKTFSGP